MNTMFDISARKAPAAPMRHRVAVERVIRTIHENLEGIMTLSDMAEIARLSPFYFNRIFHQVTGLPPTQFLWALRLEKAKRLLLTTDLSVTQICFDVGYNSLGTFTSRFTDLVGLSPRKYRNLGIAIRDQDWNRLFSRSSEEMHPKSGRCVTGNITTPSKFEGLIFIGLFDKKIPQRNPVAGAFQTRGGHFCVDQVPDGDFFLLVAALPRAEDPLEYLLPDFSKLLVGVSEARFHSPDSSHHEKSTIRLRSVQPTDPPVLVALPALIADEISRVSPNCKDK